MKRKQSGEEKRGRAAARCKRALETEEGGANADQPPSSLSTKPRKRNYVLDYISVWAHTIQQSRLLSRIRIKLTLTPR